MYVLDWNVVVGEVDLEATGGTEEGGKRGRRKGRVIMKTENSEIHPLLIRETPAFCQL